MPFIIVRSSYLVGHDVSRVHVYQFSVYVNHAVTVRARHTATRKHLHKTDSTRNANTDNTTTTKTKMHCYTI